VRVYAQNGVITLADKNTSPSVGKGDDSSRGLAKSGAVFGSMTMASRVLGVVRDMVVARYFGADAAADAFFIAFKIPNFMRRLFGEGAFSQAFVPVLSEYRQTRSLAEVKALIDRVAGVLGGILAMVTLLATLGAPLVATIFAPGYVVDAEKQKLVTDMVRITFPYLMFISLTGFAGGILNAYGKFAVPAFTPVLLNIFLISGAVLSGYFPVPIYALAWAVFVAGAMQMVFQMPFLKRMNLLPRPRWDTQHEGVRRILALIVPALFGVSVSQINLLLDTVLASFLPTGSVSWLYYSDRLWELPLGVFGVALATVILPSLSRKHADLSREAFSATMDWAMRVVFLIAIPAATALVVLAEPILISLYHYGAMTERDIAMSALSLRAYSMALLAFMLIKVLAPGYYSRQDTKTPVSIGIKAMAANMVLNLAFVIPLHVYFKIGHVGLALATMLSSYMNAYMLYRGLRLGGVYSPLAGWLKYVGKIFLATFVMAVFLLWLSPDIAEWFGAAWQQRAVILLPLCVGGMVVYGLSLMLMGVKFRHFVTKH
jgi:putative peptidoglycan lipid II flippase